MAQAQLHIDKAEYNEAKYLFEKCLAAYKKGLLSTHPKIGKCLYNLGYTHHKLGNQGEVHPMIRTITSLK